MSLEWLLSGFRWYRRLRGGIWFQVGAEFGFGPMEGWFRDPPPESSLCQRTLAVEDYATLRLRPKKHS